MVDPVLVDQTGCTDRMGGYGVLHIKSQRWCRVGLDSFGHIGLEHAIQVDPDVVKVCRRGIGPGPGDIVRLVGGVVEVGDACRGNGGGGSDRIDLAVKTPDIDNTVRYRRAGRYGVSCRKIPYLGPGDCVDRIDLVVITPDIDDAVRYRRAGMNTTPRGEVPASTPVSALIA